MPSTTLKGLTLRGVEVFVTLARTGSVAATAAELGMSAPAVSQQMKNLAQSMGVELIDHSRRPMIPTPAGRLFLPRAETALAALRMGQRDLTVLDLSGLSALSLGVIEDFENEVTPLLTARLAEAMSRCAFRLQTAASHVLTAGVEARELDMALCAAPPVLPPDVVQVPILVDPYILAVPRDTAMTKGLSGLGHLAFLRRDLDQFMGQQIEAYLAEEALDLPNRFEIDSNQSISALVASGAGWTITTPLSLLRAGRFAGGIDAYPLPGRPLARQIALNVADDWMGEIPDQIALLARELIDTHFLEPAREKMPWLGDRFALET